MTIREAIENRVRFIRLPHWNQGARLELPLLEGGGCGPWATLRDYSGETQISERFFETKIPIFQLAGDSESAYEPADACEDA